MKEGRQRRRTKETEIECLLHGRLHTMICVCLIYIMYGCMHAGVHMHTYMCTIGEGMPSATTS